MLNYFGYNNNEKYVMFLILFNKTVYDFKVSLV